MSDELDWKEVVTVSDLPPTGTEYELVPDDAARLALAQRAGVPALLSLVAKLRVLPEGRGGASVEGTLDATVQQNCVVTLEPFENPVHDTISLRFVPERSERRMPETEEIVGEDPPEPIVDGKFDLVPVVAEFLTLAIDPYPRKPGATFSQPGDEEGDEKESPFAALARLKPGTDGEKQ